MAVYGVTALAIKWTPAAVAALYLQEVRTLIPSLLRYSTDFCYLDLSFVTNTNTNIKEYDREMIY